mgnify:CR=1 FL=1
MRMENSLMNLFINEKDNERLKNDIAQGKVEIKDILFRR